MSKTEILFLYPLLFVMLMVVVTIVQVFKTKNLDDTKRYNKINIAISLTAVIIYFIIAAY